MEKAKLTFDIIECAMKVHNTLGNGFQKVEARDGLTPSDGLTWSEAVTKQKLEITKNEKVNG